MFSFVTFDIATYRYGIPLVNTREVTRATSIVPLPKAPAVIEGIIDYRGQTVPVYDIRKRFRLPTKDVQPSDKFVIADIAARTIALRADDISGLTEVAPSEIEQASAIAPRAEYLTGVIKLPEGLVLLHDLETFLDGAEAAQLDEAVAEYSA